MTPWRYLPLLFIFLLAQLRTGEAEVYAQESPDTKFPVILHGKKIPALLGQRVDHLCAYRFENGAVEAVPLQIDPVSKDGEFVLDNPSSWHRLKGEDEVLFLASDLGTKLTEDGLSLLQDQGGGTLTQELEITQAGKTSGYLYIQVSSNPSASRVRDYIRYESKSDMVVSSTYYVAYQDVIIANRLGWMELDDMLGPNQLNRVAVRFRASAFFGLIPIDITENNLVSSVAGIRDGPIRVIKRIKSGPKLPFGLRGPSNVTEVLYYPTFFQTKVAIKFPIATAVFFKDAAFRIYVALTPQPEPIDVTLPQDETFLLKPDMLTGDYVVQTEPPTWIHFNRRELNRAFAVQIRLPETSRELLSAQSLMYSFDARKRPPQGTLWFEVKVTPQSGEHGFDLYFYAPQSRERDNDIAPRAQMNQLLDLGLHPYQLKQAQSIETSTPKN